MLEGFPFSNYTMKIETLVIDVIEFLDEFTVFPKTFKTEKTKFEFVSFKGSKTDKKIVYKLDSKFSLDQYITIKCNSIQVEKF